MEPMMNADTGECLVKLAVAAKFLDMSVRSVGEMARTGKIPSVKFGKARRFLISKLREFAEKGFDHGTVGA